MTEQHLQSARPAVVEVNLDALAHNFSVIRSRVAPAKVLAVVKANAYGHGLVVCARHFEALGADYLGVGFVEEGIALRRAGVKAPILVFGGVPASQVDEFLAFDLEITASSLSKLQAIEAAAHKQGKRARVQIKIDTGMRRIGVRPESAGALFKHAAGSKHLEVTGIYSHFASSDDPDLTFTQAQLAQFQDATAALKSFPRALRHIANSAAILQHPGSYLDMVRPGIAMYGVAPDESLEGRMDLRPAMTIKSEVVYFKVVRKGEGVSYGLSWRAPRDTRVVTVPLGYGDGYQRALSNRGQVIIRGKRHPIIGRVCMDQFMADIGGNEAYNGDTVTLLGSDGAESIGANELGGWMNSISHEVLTMMNERVPRVYKGSKL